MPGHLRDAARQALTRRGIQNSLHYPPIHLFSAFETLGTAALPKTEEFSKRVITLPMYPGLPDEAPGRIVSELALALDQLAGAAATGRALEPA